MALSALNAMVRCCRPPFDLDDSENPPLGKSRAEMRGFFFPN
jgi:hypothetical protein